MSSYMYFEIKDVRHDKGLTAGDVYDGNLYHQVPDNRKNAQWKFVNLGHGYYHIFDLKHNKALVAGDVYDGHVYHQDPHGRLNAEWKLVNTETPGIYRIVDRKHNHTLVAGNIYDGNVYHGSVSEEDTPDSQSNAFWKLILRQAGELGPTPFKEDKRQVTDLSKDVVFGLARQYDKGVQTSVAI